MVAAEKDFDENDYDKEKNSITSPLYGTGNSNILFTKII